MTEKVENQFADITPITRADELAYIVFERTDVDTMSKFLVDFGLTIASQEDKSTYFRGFGDLPYCVEVIASERDAFVGFGFITEQSDDIDTLAKFCDVEPQARSQPGGGRMIRLTDPNGLQVDYIHAIERVDCLDTREVIDQVNTPWNKTRINQTVRPPAGPAPVRALGHLVLQTPDFDGSSGWYAECFGFIASDLLHVGGETSALGLGFFRLNRGDTPTDHHTLAILAGPEVGLMHVSTETIDLDAVGQGQQHLRSKGWEHHWGMGRHELGSQIFDYWMDPAGDEWEHYADGDMMTADYPTGVHVLGRGGLWTWGEDLPPSMRPPGPAPEQAPQMVKDLVDAMLAPPRPWLD